MVWTLCVLQKLLLVNYGAFLNFKQAITASFTGPLIELEIRIQVRKS